ncbi:MAG: hypothetical protein V1721_01735 [Pseudomonadota bacterium]
MTQATPTIGANQSGLAYRNADNDGKKAILNHHKGSTAPAYAEAGIVWLDDAATPWVLKVYDGTDWIVLASINASTNAVETYHGAAGLRLLNHAADTGSANAYAVAPSPAIGAYATGQAVTLKPANTNTGASTLAVSGLTAKSIKMMDGGNLPANAMVATGLYILVYDGTNFILINPSPLPLQNLNYAADTGSANAYAVAPSPAITAYASGQSVELKPANANTGACTLAVNGLAAKNIKLLDGTNPASNAMLTTGIYRLVYDGTNFVLLNPSTVSSGGSNGGATTTSGSSDITLTSSSNRLQHVAMTVVDKKVTLPDATTLTAGGPLFAVYNSGTTYSFPVCDNVGTPKAILAPGQFATFFCSDISTAAGVWIVGNHSYDGSNLSYILHHTATVVNATSTVNSSVAMLTSTKAIAVYRGTSNFAQAVILDVSGNIITAGTPVSISAENSPDTEVVALTSTSALMIYRGVTSVKIRGCVLSVSGSTITVNTLYDVVASGSPGTCHLALLSSTKAICAFFANTGTAHKAVIIDVSGTTLSMGTAVTVLSSAGSDANDIVALSSTKAMITYGGTSGYLAAMILDVSGSTITTNTALTNISASTVINYPPSPVALSSTKVLCFYVDSSTSVKAVVLSVSGSAITAGALKSFYTLAANETSAIALSSTKAFVIYAIGSYATLQSLIVTADTVANTVAIPPTAVDLAAMGNSGHGLCALSPGRILSTYSGVSAYLNTAIEDIVY